MLLPIYFGQVLRIKGSAVLLPCSFNRETRSVRTSAAGYSVWIQALMRFLSATGVHEVLHVVLPVPKC